MFKQARDIEASGFTGDADFIATQSGFDGLTKFSSSIPGSSFPTNGLKVVAYCINASGAVLAPGSATLTFTPMQAISPEPGSNYATELAAAQATPVGEWQHFDNVYSSSKDLFIRVSSPASLPVGTDKIKVLVDYY